jgi:FeS assembly SUF system regulator
MIRMSKLTDYGIVLLTHLASGEGEAVRTAQELAHASGVPLPTVSKILKALSKAGLVVSHRGRRGGYGLLRPAEDLSVAEIIAALEGPIGITECSAEIQGGCSLEAFCQARGHWGPISRAIERALGDMRLSAMAAPRPTQILSRASSGGATP